MYNRVVFIGSKKSGLLVLQTIYHIAPDRIVGCITVDDSNDTRSELVGIKQFCKQKAIKLEVLMGKCDISAAIDFFQPDLCFVMGWYYMIPDAVLEKVKGGFLGIHNSLLPKYRGFAPAVWAMINGESETGFSVFSFASGMDTGKLWYQKSVEITDKDYIVDVLDKIDKEIIIFLNDKFSEILSGVLCPYEQSEEGISYGAKRTELDGKIDWGQDAKCIYDFIRAQAPPYPGAYSFYEGKKIRIVQAGMFSFPLYGNLGQIGLIDKEKQEVVIVCGNNTGLSIKEIQVEGNVVLAHKYFKSLAKRFES